METILKRVSTFIAEERLLTGGDKVLVALSGGADSVALLRILLDLGYSCEAAHCNFCLRGEESDRDEAFVRRLCRQWNVPLQVIHFQTREEATRRHVSIEMAARDLRYAWFKELRKKLEAQAIAVAHHQDDNVETFLLNLIRGAGLNGLRGIRPKNGFIVRPLLPLSREHILQYLQARQQPYVTDSSNLEDEYLRNKIRLHLLPFLQTLNPSIRQTILQTISHLNDAYPLYLREIEQGKQHILTVSDQSDGEIPDSIHIPALLKEPSPGALLHEILTPLGFNGSQLQDIRHSLTGQSGKLFESPLYRVVKDRNSLLIEQKGDIHPPVLHYETLPYSPSFEIPRERHTACFDADKLTGPLTLRRYQKGDSFVPFGMKGRKKVSDYLTDRKFSRLQKEKQWVLCTGPQAEEIIWLVGERTDNRFRIDENTQKVLLIKAKTTG